MEYDDVRYFVMKAVTASVGQVLQKTKEVTDCYCSDGSGSGLCILCMKQGGISGIWEYLGAREISVPTEGIDFFLYVCQYAKTGFTLKLKVFQDILFFLV